MDKDQVIDTALRLHAQLQDELKVAIDKRLGLGAWTWETLGDRLRIESDPETHPEAQVYLLDHEPLLRAHQLEVEQHERYVCYTRRLVHL